jgi:hypothetical protein
LPLNQLEFPHWLLQENLQSFERIFLLTKPHLPKWPRCALNLLEPQVQTVLLKESKQPKRRKEETKRRSARLKTAATPQILHISSLSLDRHRHFPLLPYLDRRSDRGSLGMLLSLIMTNPDTTLKKISKRGLKSLTQRCENPGHTSALKNPTSLNSADLRLLFAVWRMAIGALSVMPILDVLNPQLYMLRNHMLKAKPVL